MLTSPSTSGRNKRRKYYERLQQNLINKTKSNKDKSRPLLDPKHFPSDFFEFVSLYGYTERNEPMTFFPWHKELSLFLEYIPETYTTGAAQIGKTLWNLLFLCYWVLKGYNGLWVFDQEKSLHRLVPLQFKPLMGNLLKRLGIRDYRILNQANNLFKINEGNAIFTYASTTKMMGNSNTTKGSAAGSSTVSLSADILFLEERSQYPQGADTPLYRRIDASRLPTAPVKQLGTPGNGNGIEAEIRRAKYNFYPHIICPHCKKELELTPKGMLFRPSEKGSEEDRYLSLSGRPLEWFHTDINNSIQTAYIGCYHCFLPVEQNYILNNAYFKCLNTKAKLINIIEKIKNEPNTRTTAGINLSPLLRNSQFNLAEKIVREVIKSSNPEDSHQQILGLPSQGKGYTITIELITKAFETPIPDFAPTIRLIGVDQGRGELWYSIVDVYIPELLDNRGDLRILYPSELFPLIKRSIIAGGASTKPDLLDIIAKYKPDFGLIDIEPNRETASLLAQDTIIDTAKQVETTNAEFQRSMVYDNGIGFPCWKIRNQKYFKEVAQNFRSGNYILPESWTRWLSVNTEMSPLRHLQSPYYDPDTGKCVRTDHIDDIYYTLLFVEAAIAVWYRHKRI